MFRALVGASWPLCLMFPCNKQRFSTRGPRLEHPSCSSIYHSVELSHPGVTALNFPLQHSWFQSVNWRSNHLSTFMAASPPSHHPKCSCAASGLQCWALPIVPGRLPSLSHQFPAPVCSSAQPGTGAQSRPFGQSSLFLQPSDHPPGSSSSIAASCNWQRLHSSTWGLFF